MSTEKITQKINLISLLGTKVATWSAELFLLRMVCIYRLFSAQSLKSCIVFSVQNPRLGMHNGRVHIVNKHFKLHDDVRIVV